MMLQHQMGMGMQQKQPQQFDPKKLLAAESKRFKAFTDFAGDMDAARKASEAIATGKLTAGSK